MSNEITQAQFDRNEKVAIKVAEGFMDRSFDSKEQAKANLRDLLSCLKRELSDEILEEMDFLYEL